MNNKTFALISAFCFSQAIICPSSGADSTAEQMHQAQVLYNKKQYEPALNLLDKVLTAEPKNAEAHYLAGNNLMMVNDQMQARTEYETAKALSPTGQIADYCNQALARMVQPAPAPAQPANNGGNAAVTINTNQSLVQQFITVPVGKRFLLVNKKLLERDEVRRLIQECDNQMGQKEKDFQDRLVRIQDEMTNQTNGTAAFKEAHAAYAKQMDMAKIDADNQEILLQQFYSKKINSFWSVSDMKRAYHQ